MARKNQIVSLLLQADFTITDRRYIGFEEDTSYHHFAIDVAKEYEV
jgi:ribose 5-phosphate isomerase RpiB